VGKIWGIIFKGAAPKNINTHEQIADFPKFFWKILGENKFAASVKFGGK